MIKAVLFDMDGVLVDNSAVHLEAFDLFCRRRNVTDWREKFQSGLNGMGNDDIMRALLPAELVERVGVQALGEEKEAIYREIYRPVEIEGLTELLKAFRARSLRCAVGSSGCRANVDFVLRECRIGAYFDARISGDRVTRCKPDPEIYLTAAAALGVDPSECIVFEDALAGVESAERAGVAMVTALATTHTAEYLRQHTKLEHIILNYKEFDLAWIDSAKTE